MPAWSHWPLALSLAFHLVVVGLGLFRPHRVEHPILTDFWAGKTFEAPDWDDPTPGQETSTPGVEAEQQVSPSPKVRSSPVAPTPLEKSPSLRSRAPAAPMGRDASASRLRTGGQENGEFGAEAAAAGLRDLLRSFVRAIPAAASGDPAWATVPVGPAGAVDLTLVLDDEAKVHTSEALDPRLPPHLRRLILKTLLILSGGRFAMSGDGPSIQRLHIAAAVTQLAPPPGSQAESGGVFGLGFEPADQQGVTRGFFTLASGRHVEVTVRPLR